MQEVSFVKTTIENYYKAPTHDANNIYFTTDTRELYMGDIKFGAAFIIATDESPLPETGREGYLYIDKSNGSFSIKVWDDINKIFVALPLADTSYVKSLSRQDQTIIGTKGDTTTDVVPLDSSLSINDIDSLFDEEDEG